MPHFSNASEKHIATLHPELERVLRKAIEIIDFAVIEGLRDSKAQAKAVSEGRSKTTFPKSRHNRSTSVNDTYDYYVSDAVDLAPYPIKWPDVQKQTAKEYVKRMGAFYRLAGVILTIAHSEGIELRWGGDFKSFFDGPHFERVTK